VPLCFGFGFGFGFGFKRKSNKLRTILINGVIRIQIPMQ